MLICWTIFNKSVLLQMDLGVNTIKPNNRLKSSVSLNIVNESFLALEFMWNVHVKSIQINSLLREAVPEIEYLDLVSHPVELGHFIKV